MLIHVCDNCRKEIPVVKKTIWGVEREVLDVGCITLEQAPDYVSNYISRGGELCKTCAKLISSQLDYELLKMKAGFTSNTSKNPKEKKKDSNHIKVKEMVVKKSTDEIPYVSRIHSKWEICSDGYYPYCANCHYEPSPEEELSSTCPKCGAMMANANMMK